MSVANDVPDTPSTKVTELYGMPTFQSADWKLISANQHCPFLNRRCVKNRKSEPQLTIGTCSMAYAEGNHPVMICPARLLERNQIFTDCIHLLTLHEPGNELRVVGELSVPGGSIDYCLVSVRDGKVKDFVGIELQTLDTTGTAWPERQRFLRSHGLKVKLPDAASARGFGMNWKMTAKTILVQLNHKVETFEHLNKHIVLVLQDRLLSYMRGAFAFGHIKGVRDGDPMHMHAYELRKGQSAFSLRLDERLSTDSAGVAACLGLQVNAKVELTTILSQIEKKLPKSTLLTVGSAGALPVPKSLEIDADGQ